MLIVGPSGAGKDAILQDVRKRFAQDGRFMFPRRIVTRPASAAEEHDTVSNEDFDTLSREGALALHWQAHGLKYGIPADIDTAVRRGSSVIFNISRRLVRLVKARYLNVAIVMIDAPAQLRAARLAARDREGAKDAATRIKRVVEGFSVADADLMINNAGALEQASDLLVTWLEAKLQAGH